ncbi:MAG: hypothetical protein V3T84_08370 [Phycisphaerales bacterium]
MTSLLEQVYAANVSREDVSDPNALLAEVAMWPEHWWDHFTEHEAIFAGKHDSAPATT